MDLILGKKRELIFNKTIYMRPVPKASIRVTKTGHSYYPKITNQAMDRIKQETFKTKMHMFQDPDFRPMTAHNEPLFSEAIYVELVFAFCYPKNVKPYERPYHNVKPDIDNLAKLTLDALQPHIIKDDCLICELNKKKIYDENYYIKIMIRDV